VLARPASPGRRPFEIASPGMGERTEEDSTNAIDPPPASSPARTRPSLAAPRKTLSNADRQASSPVVIAVLWGGPPTLISAPSRRPNDSRAAATRRSGAPGSALPAATQAARPAPSPSAAAAAAAAPRAPPTAREPPAPRPRAAAQ